MGRYVALLRGINFGGNNLIKMAALAAAFEKEGFHRVATYIQSGNVLFDATGAAPAKLVGRVEAMLDATFDYRAKVVILSRPQLRRVVDEAPQGFGSEPAKYRYDVLYLMPPLKAAAAVASVPAKAGVDRVAAGPGVLYFSRLVARATQSQLSRIVAMPIYKSMTIRNWNTTIKLLERMEAP